MRFLHNSHKGGLRNEKTSQLLPPMIEKFIDIHRLSEGGDFTWVYSLQTEQTEINLLNGQIERRQTEGQTGELYYKFRY